MWFVLSLLSAISKASFDVFGKKGMGNIDVFLMGAVYRLIGALLILPFLLWQGLPEIKIEFWFALLLGGTLNFITTILYLRAIKYSDLSLAAPMLSFTPVFLLLTSPIMLGEFPDIAGIIGICLVVGATYYLNVAEKGQSVWRPFQLLRREKGMRYMLLVAFIWSFTSNFDKIGVVNSSPMCWLVLVNLYAAALCFIATVWRRQLDRDKIAGNIRNLGLMGALTAAETMFQFHALQYAIVPYVIAVKRTSIIFSVIFGGVIFREKNIRKRVLASSLMFLGVLFILFSSYLK